MSMSNMTSRVKDKKLEMVRLRKDNRNEREYFTDLTALAQRRGAWHLLTKNRQRLFVGEEVRVKPEVEGAEAKMEPAVSVAIADNDDMLTRMLKTARVVFCGADEEQESDADGVAANR